MSCAMELAMALHGSIDDVVEFFSIGVVLVQDIS